MHIPSGLNPHFRAIAWIGLGLMIVDTVMSATFGLTIGYIPMIGLALISLGSGLLLVAAEFFRRVGWRSISIATTAVWFLAFVFNAWSNMGVATSTRMGEVQQATVQQKTYAERQQKTEEAKTRLNLFTKQLNELTSQNEWAATVSTDGLRQQVADLRSARDSEAKLGGCGRKCRGLENQISEVSGRIAVAEQRDDLTKRIEATKAVLAKARTELAGTKAGISATANQSTLYAKLISFNLAADPDVSAVTVANEGTGVAMAIVIAIASAFLTLIGALPHLTCASPMSAMPEPQRPVAPSMWSKPREPSQGHADAGPANAILRQIEERLASVPARDGRDARIRVEHVRLGDVVAAV